MSMIAMQRGAVAGWLGFSLALVAGIAEGGEIRGVVYRANGSAAAGASVWAVPRDQTLRRADVRAGEDGSYRLDLAEGQWWIAARYEDEGGEPNSSDDLCAIKGPQTQDIYLQTRGRLQGCVCDESTGRPLVDARLYLDSGEVVVTDRQGRFATGGLRQKSHEMFVVCAGHARTRVLFDNTLRQDTKLNMTVPAGEVIQGKVQDEHGKPIGGAYVDRPSSGTIISLRGLEVWTDESGRFEYDGARDGGVGDFAAGASGYEGSEFHAASPTPATQPVIVTMHRKAASSTSSGKQRAINTVFPTRALAGRVLADGQPVQSAEIRWGATEYESVDRRSTSDAQGQFQLADAPDCEGYITVVADRYAPAFIKVEKGQKRVEVALSTGASVGGTVVDLQDRPVYGVWITPVIRSPDSRLCNPLWLENRSTHSDPTGHFEIHGLPRNAAFDFLKGGFSDSRNVALIPDKMDSRVKLTPTGAIRGRVIGPDGKPVSDFRITLTIPQHREADDVLGGFFAGFEWPGILFTDANGEFQVSELTAGSWVAVSAMASGFGICQSDRVQARPITDWSEKGELLLRLGAAHHLVVHVSGKSPQTGASEPVAGARVILLRTMDKSIDWTYAGRSWDPSVSARTDAHGEAAFDPLIFDQAEVLVAAPGYTCARVSWRAEQPLLEVGLSREAVVTGTVIGPQGEPLREGWISISADGGRDRFSGQLLPDDHGRFKFGGLWAGGYTIEASYDQSKMLDRKVHIEEGQHLQIDPGRP